MENNRIIHDNDIPDIIFRIPYGLTEEQVEEIRAELDRLLRKLGDYELIDVPPPYQVIVQSRTVGGLNGCD